MIKGRFSITDYDFDDCRNVSYTLNGVTLTCLLEAAVTDCASCTLSNFYYQLVEGYSSYPTISNEKKFQLYTGLIRKLITKLRKNEKAGKFYYTAMSMTDSARNDTIYSQICAVEEDPSVFQSDEAETYICQYPTRDRLSTIKHILITI